MGYIDQHSRERPSLGNSLDDEISALFTLRLIVSTAKSAALGLMLRFPQHRSMCQSIADFATDGESDIRGTINQLEDEQPRRPDRGGAT